MRILILSTNPQFTRGLSVGLALVGHRVFACTDHAGSPQLWSRHVRHVLHATRDELDEGSDAFIGKLNNTIRRRRIDAVVAADARPTAMLCRRQGDLDAEVFPVDSFDNFDRLRDKQRFAELLRMIGIRQPAFHAIRSLGDVDTLPFDGPYVVKPPMGEGQTGVAIADHADDLRHYIARIGEGELPQLVQQYIPGRDIDLSFLADRGELVAWTIQRPVPGRPGVLEFLEHPGVLDAGRRLCAATKFHGVAHLDLRIDERNNDVHIIEANPRFWFSMRHSFAMGVNFVDLGLRLMRGETVTPMREPPTGICPVPGFTPVRWPAAILGFARPASPIGDLFRVADTDPLPDMIEYARRMPKPWKRAKSLAIELPNVADRPGKPQAPAEAREASCAA